MYWKKLIKYHKHSIFEKVETYYRYGSNKKYSVPRSLIVKITNVTKSKTNSRNIRRKEAWFFPSGIYNLGPMFLWVTRTLLKTLRPRGAVSAERLTIAIIQTSPMIVHGVPWRESKRAIATSRAQCCSAKFSSSARKKENQRKSRGKKPSRKAVSDEVERLWACCTVASADNFFPSVKSLSSPRRFPKNGDRTWMGEKCATRCRKVLRCRTCSRSLSLENETKSFR